LRDGRGSAVKAGLVTDTGQVLMTHRVPSHPGWGRKQVLADIEAALAPLADGPVEGLAVGVPCFGDFPRGMLYAQHSLFPCLAGFPLPNHLEQRYQVPVHLANDANLFTLGLSQFGEGRDYQDFVGITLGSFTGIGVVLGGRLAVGPLGFNEVVRRFGREWEYRSGGTKLHDAYSFRHRYGADGATLYARALSNDGVALDAFASIGMALSGSLGWLHRELRLGTSSWAVEPLPAIRSLGRHWKPG
jgi:glucokinase